MSAFGVDVEFGRDVCFLELHEIDDGVLDVDGVVLGLHDEGGWRSDVGLMSGLGAKSFSASAR